MVEISPLSQDGRDSARSPSDSHITEKECDSLSTHNQNGMSSSTFVEGLQKRHSTDEEIGEPNAQASGRAKLAQSTDRGELHQRAASNASSKVPHKAKSGKKAPTGGRASAPKQSKGEEGWADVSSRPTASSIRAGPAIPGRHPVAKEPVSDLQAVKTPMRTSSIGQTVTRAVNPARQPRNAPRKIERRAPRKAQRDDHALELEPYEIKLTETRQRIADNRAAAHDRKKVERATAAEAQKQYMEHLSTPRSRGHHTTGSITGSKPDSPMSPRSVRRVVPRVGQTKQVVNLVHNSVLRGGDAVDEGTQVGFASMPQEMRQVGPNLMVTDVAISGSQPADPRLSVSGPSRGEPTTSSCNDGTAIHMMQSLQHRSNRGHHPEPKSKGFLGQITSFLSQDDELEKQAHRIATMDHNIHVLSQQLDFERRKNEKLQKDLLELKETNDQFAADLREVQVKSFKEMVKSSWTPMEDHVISEILGDVHKEIEDWCEEHCVEDFEQMCGRLSEEEERFLLDFLKLVTVVVSDDFSEQLGWWIEKAYDPVLVMTAVMIHLMYSSVCVNEFLVIDALLGGAGASAPLLQTYRALLAVNAKQANLWRAQLMRTLLPKPLTGGAFSGLQPAKAEIGIFLRCFCEARVAMLESGFVKAFLRPNRAADSNEALVSSWIRVAELFTQLQTQLSRVYWCNPEENSLIGTLYEERLTEAHRCQYTEEKQGKLIGLVVSPYLQLFGNEDGERYDRARIIRKATVLVHDDEDFEIVEAEVMDEG